MIILWIACILAITATPIHSVLNNGGGPAPVYGPPPPPRIPHREYGAPQQIPFREYGPPSGKYGPPKLNVNFGHNFKGGFNDQVKTHFGIPRPFYGPPHHQNRPNGLYGPPPPQGKPFFNFGPIPQQLSSNYGPPRPAATYGPPLPQPLPLVQPGPAFKPGGSSGFVSRPHTSYGPPPSGQFISKPNLNFRPPSPSYGPPPLPNLNRLPETTIILTNSGTEGGAHNNFGPQGGPVKQVQIQIENQGNSHSGSNGHFHTASCDGWKPIPAPVGQYVEQNSIQTQSGYNSVIGGLDHTLTQYNSGNGNSNIGGLTDEQLVAVALQSGSFDTAPTQSLPAAGPVDFHANGGSAGGIDNQLNSIESEALQISLASIEDTYSKPPQDSFAPNSVHAQKYNTIGGNGGQDLVPPSGAYGTPSTDNGNFQNNFIHHSEGGASYSSQSGNLGILYGTQTGNQRPWLNNGLMPPNKPVTYRPPVPQGLLESIGQTVQHLDQFGVKPPNQPSTYIPPPPKEIAEPSNQYGPPQPQFPPSSSHQSIKIEFQQQGTNQYLPQPPPPPPHPIPSPIQQQQYLPPPRSNHHYQGGSSNFATSFGQQFIHSQGLPLTQEARFNQPQDCGHGPNLVGANYQIQQQLPQPSQYFQEQNIGHPANTYGPPLSPTGSGLDVIGYESKQSSVTSLPDVISSDNLPGLDGLNVISAQKSQNIPIGVQNQQTSPFQIQIQSSGPGESSTLGNDGHTNHDEVLSEGLLQSILNAIEQPQNNNLATTPQLQNRSDNEVHLDEDTDEKGQSSISTKNEATSTKKVYSTDKGNDEESD